jgi:hypothetical protein
VIAYLMAIFLEAQHARTRNRRQALCPDSPKRLESVSSKGQIILIPFLPCFHPLHRIVADTGPKLFVTRIAFKDLMETKTLPTKIDLTGTP